MIGERCKCKFRYGMVGGVGHLKTGEVLWDATSRQLKFYKVKGNMPERTYSHNVFSALPRFPPMGNVISLSIKRKPADHTEELYIELPNNRSVTELYSALKQCISVTPPNVKTGRGLYQTSASPNNLPIRRRLISDGGAGKSTMESEASTDFQKMETDLKIVRRRLPVQMDSVVEEVHECAGKQRSSLPPTEGERIIDVAEPCDLSWKGSSNTGWNVASDGLTDHDQENRENLCKKDFALSEREAFSGESSDRTLNSSPVSNFHVPPSCDGKKVRPARRILSEIDSQVDSGLVSSSHSASSLSPFQTFRRRISGVEDTLICSQSPKKSPQKQLFSLPDDDYTEETTTGGFANLGNSCYMNAILQSLFSIETFSNDLRKLDRELCEKKGEGLAEHSSLLSALCDLACHRLQATPSETTALLFSIKSAVKNDVMRFCGTNQEDAQEFLTQVLDQLREEYDSVMRSVIFAEKDKKRGICNPVCTNFMFRLQNDIVCESCGNVVSNIEESTALPMPLVTTISSPLKHFAESPVDQISIQTLLDECLRDEKVDYRCEQCQSVRSVMTHRFCKLPRCLIVFPKRYSYDSFCSRGSKRVDAIRIPLYLTLDGHCVNNSKAGDSFSANARSAEFADLNLVISNSLTQGKSVLAKRRFESPGQYEMKKPKTASNISPIVSNRENETDCLSLICEEAMSEEKVFSSPCDMIFSADVERPQVVKSDVVGQGRQSECEKVISFMPLDIEARKRICERLNLTPVTAASTDLKDSDKSAGATKISVLDFPTRIHEIHKDGNCLFRALAYCITGHDDEYKSIRKAISVFEGTYSDFFRRLSGMTNDEWKEHLEKLSHDSEWGGDLELSAFATMLDIEIWTFANKRWICSRPRFVVEQGKLEEIATHCYRFGERFAICLQNQNFRYSPVLEISSDNATDGSAHIERRKMIFENAEKGFMTPSYRLVSVVSHFGDTNTFGHYVSDIWSQSDNSWLHCDDSSVTKTTEEVVRNGRTTSGYVFFYIASGLFND